MNILRTINYTMRVAIISAVCDLFCLQNSYACGWAEFYTFAEVAKVNGNTTIRGTIKAHGPRLEADEHYLTTMHVDVTDVILGEYVFDEAIFVGEFTTSCGVLIDPKLYEIDSEHLFLVRPEQSLHALAEPGEPSLQIVDNRINGIDIVNYNRVPYSYDLSEFITLLRSED